MTDLEAEDAQTIHPTPRHTGCRCASPGRACGCDDDGTTAEPREWVRPDKPETITAPARAPLPAAPAFEDDHGRLQLHGRSDRQR